MVTLEHDIPDLYVTPPFVLALRHVLDRTQQTPRRLGISRRNWQLWNSRKYQECAKKGTPHRVNRSTARMLCERLGALVSDFHPSMLTSFSDVRFGEFEAWTRGADSRIMQTVRDHQHLARELLEQEYEDLIRGHLERYQLNVSTFVRLINHPWSREKLAGSLPQPDVTVHIDPALRFIEFVTPGGTALRVTHPHLLWDCACRTPRFSGERASVAKKRPPCPICDHPHGPAVRTAMDGLVLLKYGALKFFWRKNSAWPPSIDSFGMIRAVLNYHRPIARERSVLDLGAGTGFLGIAYAAAVPGVQQLALTDWLLTPLLYGAVNAHLNRDLLADVDVELRLGIFSNWLQSDRLTSIADVVLCNPPYMPRIRGFESVFLDAPVACTDLLEHVIQNAPRLGHAVYINYSHLAAPEARGAAKRAGILLKPISKPRRIPFRVKDAIGHPQYLRALIRLRKLQVATFQRHPLWHRVLSVCCMKTDRPISGQGQVDAQSAQRCANE